MPYKISGTINTSAKIYAVDMDSGTFLNSVDATPTSYELVASPFINGVSGTVSVVAVTPEGESLGFSEVLPIEFAGDRAVFGGGSILGASAYDLYYISVSTLSNSNDFGEIRTDATAATTINFQAGTSNGGHDRGLLGNGGYYLTVDYITISTLGSTTFFGNLKTAIGSKIATSNKKLDRAVWMGGQSGTYFNYIDYNTISTLGEAQDFGDLTQPCRNGAAFSNATGDRGVRAGGVYSSSHTAQTDYITISTPSNAAYFGTLTVSRGNLDGTSNDTGNRGLAAGGSTAGTTYVNTIDYFTISTTGNANDFGDLTQGRGQMASDSNGINNRAVWCGGYYNDGSSTYVNIIDYNTITTLANSSDFGDVAVATQNMASCNNA